MNNTLIIAGCSGAITMASFMLGVGSYEVVDAFVHDPKPYGMQVVSLDYNAGMFHQLVRPINADAVRAEWAAKITRNGVHLCSGGSVSLYTGTSISMTPSQWTGDECPVLQAGDSAFASWTYENVDGKNITISSEVIIK